MSKRPYSSSARTPRRTRRSRLVSPLASSKCCLTPTPNVECVQDLFSTPVLTKSDIVENRIDASIHSHAQLKWFQSHDVYRYKTSLDFSWCEDSVLSFLSPSKFGGGNRIPMSHRHTATSIRQFQKLGNKQQLHLISKDIASLPPLTRIECISLFRASRSLSSTNVFR